MGRALFSIAVRDVHPQGQAGFSEVMEQDPPPEPVQVHLSARVTVALIGPRATADFKAGPMRAELLREAVAIVPSVGMSAEEVTAVVLVVIMAVLVEMVVEDTMVEDVVNGNLTRAAANHVRFCWDHHQITERWR